MTSLWWRSWHGAPTDPKWIAIAKRSETQPGIVSAIAWALFDHASQQGERGDISRFDPETYAAFSGFDQLVIEAVMEAMREKELIVNNRLSAWEGRQPQREDNSTERVRKHRNAVKRDETQGNAILDKIRLDKKDIEDDKKRKSRKQPEVALSSDWKPNLGSVQKAQALGFNPREISLEAEKFKNHARQKDRRAVRWDAAFDNWMINAAEYQNKSPPETKSNGGFSALPGSPEFQAWRTYHRDKDDRGLIRILEQRELEGRAFNFESQWPPGHRTEAA